MVLCMCTLTGFSVRAAESDESEQLIRDYNEYMALFAAIEDTDDIEPNGFYRIEDQSFPVVLESFSDGETEVNFIPVMYEKYHRLGVLITDNKGKVLYKTNQLETNNKWLGQMEQPTKGVAAVSFQDLNRDGLTDIILITECENEEGKYAGRTYKTGDVLFQRDGGFYRDWRVSDKINRFSMNKSADFIASYVRDGNSTEILYPPQNRLSSDNKQNIWYPPAARPQSRCSCIFPAPQYPSCRPRPYPGRSFLSGHKGYHNLPWAESSRLYLPVH